MSDDRATHPRVVVSWGRRILKWAGISVMVLAIGAAFAWLVADGHSRGVLHDAKRRWEASVGPLGVPSPPPAPPNATAVALDEIAAGLGYRLALHLPVSEATADSGKPNRLGLSEYILAEIRSPSGEISAPSGELASWLGAHRGEILKLVEVLDTQPRPRWGMPVPATTTEPIPNMLGHLFTARVVVLASLDAAARGDDGEAERALRAAFTLSRSLQDEPVTLAHVLAARCLQEELAVLRRLPSPSDDWPARIATIEDDALFLHALAQEATVLLWPVDRPEEWLAAERERDARVHGQRAASLAPVASRLGISWPEAPRRRLAAAAALDAQRTLIETARADPCLAAGSAAIDSRLQQQWPRSAEAAIQPSARLIDFWGRVRLQADLTRAMLKARAAGGDHAVYEGSCPGWKWSARPVDPVTVEMRFTGDGTMPHADPNKDALPIHGTAPFD